MMTENPEVSGPRPPGISVVLVAYNVREYLDACLQSIRLAATHFPCAVEVIVCDNDSRDGTVPLLQPRWPEATWISLDRNLGFGTACNRGAAASTQPLLLFLNPDTLVREDTFQVMADFFRMHPDAGAVGCKVVNRDGTLQLACKRSFPSPRVAAFKLFGLGSLFPKSRVFGRYNLTYLDENQTHEVDAVSGSFLCIDADLFRQVGGFDEDFFMYGEDLDLCFRVKSHGNRNFYHPATQILHFKGESVKSRPFRSFFNFYEAMVIFSRKHLELRILPFALLHAGVGVLAVANFISGRFQKWPRWLADLLLVNAVLAGVTDAYEQARHIPLLMFTEPWLYLFWHALVSLSVLAPLAYLGEYSRVLPRPKTVFLAICEAFPVFFSFSFFMKERAYSRVVFGLTAVISIVLLMGWRLVVNQGGRFWRRVLGAMKRVAILGTNARAQGLADLILNEKLEGYEFVGFLQFPRGPIPREMRANVIGDIDTLPALARKLDLQGVIIALEEDAYATALQVLSARNPGRLEVKMLIGSPDSEKVSLIDLNFRK